jgi:hypothetical protein
MVVEYGATARLFGEYQLRPALVEASQLQELLEIELESSHDAPPTMPGAS